MRDWSGLNLYSRQCAERLFKKRPDWETFAESALLDKQQILRLTLRHPDNGRQLILDTLDDEITVAFLENGRDGEWHTHYGEWSGLSEEEALDAALETIDGI